MREQVIDAAPILHSLRFGSSQFISAAFTKASQQEYRAKKSVPHESGSWQRWYNSES